MPVASAPERPSPPRPTGSTRPSGSTRQRSLGRRIRGQAPFLSVLAVLGCAFTFLLVAPTHWRYGVAIIAGALFVAAGWRAVLSRPTAGMLAVRARWIDLICYLSLGTVILLVDVRLH